MTPALEESHRRYVEALRVVVNESGALFGEYFTQLVTAIGEGPLEWTPEQHTIFVKQLGEVAKGMSGLLKELDTIVADYVKPVGEA